jgi:hypothetical protein
MSNQLTHLKEKGRRRKEGRRKKEEGKLKQQYFGRYRSGV